MPEVALYRPGNRYIIKLNKGWYRLYGSFMRYHSFFWGFMVIKKIEQKDFKKAIDIIWDTMLENNLIKEQYLNYECKNDYYNSIMIQYLQNEITIVGAYIDGEIVGTIIFR